MRIEVFIDKKLSLYNCFFSEARTSITGNINNEFAEFNSYLSRKSFIENIVNKFGTDLNQDSKGKKLLTILHNTKLSKPKFTKINVSKAS